ncbi:endonuclease/exonuclease/phosphatase family protein [Luteimonas sp. RD2P54]|uniref:Endonuclease/exonuclease/phosphatase family protein n=1 Tax=Luteimonas endophytica TaxID=3042023 RepID=A0ABT6J8U5_9GAMM|nr:endonuclease/exonuclease/phosphatase family protein [Luteimonas endophytica]MDH5823241.1 endonuclease/exonuclease/phosphatase family protein [Luteimonas endophytica]
MRRQHLRLLSHWTAVALAVLALAACATSPPAPAAGTLTVVTLNLYHDRDHWPKRRPLVIEGLRALQPDAIALQEVLQHAALRNQAEDIAAALGYQAHFVSHDPEAAPRRYGNAILTRRPVLERGGIPLEPPGDARTLAHLRIDADGRAVDLYATHLHHTRDGTAMRAGQLRQALEHVQSRADGAPAVLAGDFNALAAAQELEPLRERGFVDAFGSLDPSADAVTTLNPHYFGEQRRRIDHVFVRGLEVLEARRVLDTPDAAGTWPSDHFGVFVRLRVPRTR